MIDQEKYVKIVANPLERQSADEQTVNNVDATFTENGIYTAELPYTGFGIVTVAVPEKVIQSLSITPTTSQQTISAGGGVDGYAPITVNAVTSAIDSNIQAGNIKSGVSILGVQGSVVELKGQTRDEYLTWYTGNVFEPNSGYNGITSIVVRPKNYTTNSGSYYIVTPTTSQQTVSIPNGYSGIGALRVEAVTSSIDSNIQAQNIVQGTTILGVVGTAPAVSYPYRQMSVSNGKLLAYVSGYSMPIKTGDTTITDVGEFALASSCRSLNYTGNINWNSLTTISGERAFTYCYYYSNITGNITFNGLQTVLANYAFYYAFSNSTITGNIEFKGIVDMTGGYYYTYQFYYAFAYATLGVVDFSNLETLSGGYNFQYAFYSSTGTAKFNKLKTISASSAFNYAFSGDPYTSGSTKGVSIVGIFDSIETVTGSSAFRYAFQYNYQISGAITFNKLSVMSGSQIFQYAFRYCPNLTSLSFPALTSTSFGSYTNQFEYMLQGCSDVTVHFPSNLQSVIGSWTSVTNGFSGTNTTVLFDLTATS